MNNTRDEAVLKKLGENLRKIRRSKKMTQQQLAFAADIELSQVHRIETGKTNPTVTTIVLLADTLGISAAKLFEF